MVYEMNKSFVTKVLIMSTVLMAGILLIPTNIHDAKANPCADATATGTAGAGGAGGQAGPAGDGGDGGNRGNDEAGGVVESQEVLVMVQRVELEQVNYQWVIPLTEPS